MTDDDDMAFFLEDTPEGIEEDSVLWNIVKQEATPLAQRAKHVQEGTFAVFVPPKIAPDPDSYSGSRDVRQGDIEPLHKDLKRKITKGRIPIERNIDLHDLTQDEAYRYLHDALYEARGYGVRTILVITGKGKAGEGILRAALPQWLVSSAFADIVHSYGAAADHHGGTGAFYIRLRRQR